VTSGTNNAKAIPAGTIVQGATSGNTGILSQQVAVNQTNATWTFLGVTNGFAVGDTITLASGGPTGTLSITQVTVSPPSITFTYTGAFASLNSGIKIQDTTQTPNSNAFSASAVTTAPVSGVCAFAIRLAPSVTNGLCGDIGFKELLNRSQLLLQKLEVTSGINVQTTGFLNPTGIVFNSANWVNVNTNANGTQPSFVQYYPGNLITGIPQPGERIFSTIVQANNQNNLDLTALKEMSNSVIGGNQNFPDGPDTLVIYLSNLTGLPGTVQANIFWSEAQA